MSLGNYTPFALCTLHHLDIFSSAPLSLLLSFWWLTLPCTSLLTKHLWLTNHLESFKSTALGPWKTGHSPCEATGSGHCIWSSCAWNHHPCPAFLHPTFTFSPNAEKEQLSLCLYVCMYLYTCSPPQKETNFTRFNMLPVLLWTLPLLLQLWF